MTHLLDPFTHCPRCGSEAFAPYDAKAKRCGRCGFTFYMNSAAAVVAILRNERGQILVARRGEEPARGTLDLPGGFVDPGESLEQALAREVREETGICIEDCRSTYLFSLPNTYPYSGLTVLTTDAFFEVDIPSGTPLHAADDVAACWWAHPEDIRPELFGLTSIREGIQRYLCSPG